jgi:diguanylate cyclase (GGDEF)-like protein/PAS domain S-box-containing protein
MAQASKRSVLPCLLLVLVGLVGLALPPVALDAAHVLAAAALVAGVVGLLLARRADAAAEQSPVAADAPAPVGPPASAPVAPASDNTKELFEDSPNGIVVTDAAGVLVDANPAFATLVGRAPAALVGTPLTALTADGREGLDDHLLTASANGRAEGDWTAEAADGSPLHLSLTSTGVGAEATPGRLVVSHVVDRTAELAHRDRLVHLTEHDALTGLANRHRFETETTRHLASCRASGATGALLLLDLDHFKEVNDTLGHGAGDELIGTMAELLAENLREGDLVARLGGDEFALLLPKADAAAARFVAQDILERVRLFAQTQEGVLRRVTASIGVVLIGDRHTTFEDLVSTADMTMYDAKEAGRDQYVVVGHKEHEQPRTGARMAWSERIHHAIEHDEFTLRLQPILDVRTGQINSAEALIRLVDGDELVLPERFLYIAERSGEIIDIDRWVIDKSVALLARIQQVHPDFQLEVNLSGKSIGSPLLDAALNQALLKHGADPTGLVLEITETAAVAHMQTALNFAERQRRLGCKFALDDFGAGYGSFYYLKHLPIDYVKIDGEFVAGCATNETDRRIVGSIVGIARGLGKQTIAEHVSSPEILRVIEEEGVDFAQGFDVSQAVTFEALMEILGFQRGDSPSYVGRRRA